MEGYCRGCLVKYEEPMDLLQYTEKNRRLFIYSTGLQVKRTDQFPFQLCRECYSNMMQSCKFKKQCRTSDKRLKNYIAMKETSDSQDFSTFLKNNDDLLLKFPALCGYSTPANQKAREDDNESTCTSIRNFMRDLVPAEDLPDADASIVRELIQEEADIMDDSLDSRWLDDDEMSQYRLDLSISPFRTPHSTGERYFARQNLGLKCLDTCQDKEKINDIAKEIMNELETKDETNLENNNSNGKDINNPIVSINGLPELDIDSNIENIILEGSGKKLNSGKGNLIDLSDIEAVHRDKSLDDHVRSLVRRQTKGKKLEKFGKVKKGKKGKNLDNFGKSRTKGKNMKLMKLLVDNIDDENSEVTENEIEKDIQTKEEIKKDEQNIEKYVNEMNFYAEIDLPEDTGDKDCIIDKNLEVALKDGEAKEYFLHDLIYTPPAPNCATAMSTPTINNILFGETLNIDYENKTPKSPGQYLKKCEDSASDINIFEDFYYKETDGVEIEPKEENDFDSEFKVPLAPPAYDLKDLICNICNKKFASVKGIKIHLRKQHPEKISLTKKKRKKPNKVVCDICGKDYFDKSTLVKHIQLVHSKDTDSNSNTCKVCLQTFSSDTKLKLHLRRVHDDKSSSPQKSKEKPGNRIYICSICGSTTPLSSNHRLHMARHNKQFTMHCSKCGKGFYRRSDLESHERAHLGVKLYACTRCDKRFARRECLNLHLKKHNDELPFRCDVCGDTFMKKLHFKKHKQSQKCINNHLKVALKRHQESEGNGKQTYYYVTEEIVQKPFSKYLAIDAKAILENLDDKEAVQVRDVSEIGDNGNNAEVAGQGDETEVDNEETEKQNEHGIENAYDNEGLGDSNENIRKDISFDIGIENLKGPISVLNETLTEEIASISRNADEVDVNEVMDTNDKAGIEICGLPDLGFDSDCEDSNVNKNIMEVDELIQDGNITGKDIETLLKM